MAKDRYVARIAPVYNRALRYISGLLPSTPAESACAELGELPFQLWTDRAIAQKGASFEEKTEGHEPHYLLTAANEATVAIAGCDMPKVASIHWYGTIRWDESKLKVEDQIQRRFKAGTKSEEVRAAVRELLSLKYPNHVYRFTDGSKSAHGVGVGIYERTSSFSKSLDAKCSVFSAEAAAISTAVAKPATGPILVLTDSASVIAATQNSSITHPWVQAVVKKAPPDTVLAWVPGHAGISGNEAADQLAGEGCSAERMTCEVPRSDLKAWLNTKAKERWSADWRRNHRHLFLAKVKGEPERWEDVKVWRDQRVLSRLRTGHTNVSHNLNGGPFRTTCETCDVPNTVEHFVCVCPALEGPRNFHGIDTTIRNALGEDSSRQQMLLNFLKDSNLYNMI